MAKEKITVDVIAWYEGIVECPYCGVDNEFLIQADKKRQDFNCTNHECPSIEPFEIKIKEN